ncbi:MAG: hypothetical protein WDM90_12520 [Ferruginibacter sp.]
MPKAGNFNKTRFDINGKQTDWTYYEHIDDKYLQALQIPLAKGRYLSYGNVADTVSNCMINETFATTLLDKTKDPHWPGNNDGGRRTIYCCWSCKRLSLE